MVVAKIHVSGIYVNVDDRKLIPAGLIGGSIEFEFEDSRWGGLTKTVVFQGCETKDVILEDSTVLIPSEVVAKPGVRLRVGVYGTSADDTVAIPTLWADLGEVRPAADPSGDPAADPTLPIWGQLAERVEELEKKPAGGGIAVSGASVGQTIKISAVDEKGVPTAWEPADFPDSGGNVAYDEEQKLTDEQKARARANIGAQPTGNYLTETEIKPVRETANSAQELAKKADKKVDTLIESVSKFHSNIVESASCDVITVSDASDLELAGLKIFGKTTQDGTPTPDAPVPLESVGDGGSVGVTVAGKNLLTAQQMYSHADSYLETTLDGRNCVRMTSGIKLSIVPDFLKPNTQYTVSLTCKNVLKPNESTSQGNNIITFFYDDGSRSELYNLGTDTDWVSRRLTSEAGKTVTSIGVFPYDYRSYTFIDVDTFQFEEGPTATDYEPYNFQNLTVQKPTDVPVFLPGIPVTSGGNYTDENGLQWICDEVDFVSDKYVQRIGKIDSYTAEDVPSAYMSSTGGLSEGATVLYALAEPIKHDLSAEELTAYAALHTNYPNTTIFNDAGAGMEVKYVVDTKLYIDKKFAELSAALLNQ